MDNDISSNDISSNDISSNDISSNENHTNEYINKITMELLMSKPNYTKYLESNDPKNIENKILYKNEVLKYKTVIKCIFEEEINNISSDFTGRSREIKDAFDDFVKECVKYIKMTEIKYENPLNHANCDDDETIFNNCDDIEEKIKNIKASSSEFRIDSDDDEEYSNKQSNSLWGGDVIKYDMKMLARRKR
jgi:hypothetical protein